MSVRSWWFVILLLFFAMGVAMFTSARLENQTWDESVHLAAGYSYITTWDFRLNWEHPALGKILAALPLLPFDPRLPTEYEGWYNGDTVAFAGAFLYRNRLTPDQLLMLGRVPTMALTLLLGVVFAWWTRRNFGPAVAAIAALLYALDPNITAHGRYVTTDLIATLTMFLSVVTWVRYLLTKHWLDLVWAAIALGFALASKFSTIFLFGLLPLLYLARKWQSPRDYSFRRLAGSMAVVFALGMTTMFVCYWKQSKQVLIDGQAAPLEVYMKRETLASELMYQVGHALDLPAHPYFLGLNLVAEHNHEGHPTYLLGRTTQKGSWAYFPVAFGVKTPAAVLLLLAFGIGGLFWRRHSGGLLVRWRRTSFVWLAITITPIAYMLFCMSSNLNLGVRHILPIYPFVFILAAAALVRKPAWSLVILVIGLQVYEYSRVSPHYLAFFNTFAGGPENGPAYLLDSNLDWGQDAKKLAAYRREHNIENLYVDYFGAVDLSYYLGPHHMLSASLGKRDPSELDGVAAISATVLMDVYGLPDTHRWFRDREPDARIGYSIYIYDLRKDRQ